MFGLFSKNDQDINSMVLELINQKDLNSNDIADVIAEQISVAKNSDNYEVSRVAKKLEKRFGSKYQQENTTLNYNEKADDFGGYFMSILVKVSLTDGKKGIASCLSALEQAYDLKKEQEYIEKKDKPATTGFSTISFLNRLITAGAEREFVHAVCAIWYLQAGNDPNTPESQQIVGTILGTLENFLVEEAAAIDDDVLKLFTLTIKNSEYGALFEETQPIFTVGQNKVHEKFPPGSTEVMEIYAHYANVMLKTTKQNKDTLLSALQALAEYVDTMCGLANQAEKNLF
jgi:hypothetical protein